MNLTFSGKKDNLQCYILNYNLAPYLGKKSLQECIKAPKEAIIETEEETVYAPLNRAELRGYPNTVIASRHLCRRGNLRSFFILSYDCRVVANATPVLLHGSKNALGVIPWLVRGIQKNN